MDPNTRDLAPNGWPRTLLASFKAGERAALTEVYRAHAEAVALMLRHGFVFESGGQRRRFVGYGSGFELQDALHETFRRAFEPRARDAYDGIRPYGPYVKTIARNLVLRGFRDRERLFPSLDEAPPEVRDVTPIALEAAPSPERAVHDRQVAALVADFLAGLEPQDRALVELRFERGLSQRDAAEALGLGRQRIRTRERNLRRRLLAYLREHGETSLVDGVVSGLSISVLVVEGLRMLGEVAR